MAPCEGTCATGERCRNSGNGSAIRCRLHVKQPQCNYSGCLNGGNKAFEGFCFDHLQKQSSPSSPAGDKVRKTGPFSSKRSKSDVVEEDTLILEGAMLTARKVHQDLSEAEALNESLRRDYAEQGIQTAELTARLMESDRRISTLQANLHETQRLLQDAESRSHETSSSEYNPEAVRAILKASAEERYGLHNTVKRLEKEIDNLNRMAKDSATVKQEAVQNFKFVNPSQKDLDDILDRIRVKDDETSEEIFQKSLRELERLSVRH